MKTQNSSSRSSGLFALVSASALALALVTTQPSTVSAQPIGAPPTSVHAASTPIYQITADLYQDGKKISSSSLTTAEGSYGGIRSHDSSGDSNALVMIPVSSSSDGSEITVDYKLVRKKGGDVLRKRDSVVIHDGGLTVVKVDRERSVGPFEIRFSATKLK